MRYFAQIGNNVVIRINYLPFTVVLPFLLLCSLTAAPEAQEAEWRTKIREALLISDPLPLLAPRSHDRFEPAPGVTAERVTYGTQFGMRVPAILYARAGAAVLTYDPTGEGERNGERKSGTREHDEVELPAELAQRLGGLMVTDVMQAVSYLAQRPEVDSKRIAAAGYSMGSFILALAGAVDTRLRATVLVGGGNLDGPNGYWDNSKSMCQGTPYRSLQPLGDRPAVIYALHAARGSTLIFNGLEDETVRIPKNAPVFFEDLRRRTVKMRGGSDRIFDVGFVPGVGHRPFFVTQPVASWLERQLDFPNWREADLEKMPVTHISEWARAQHVEMDPLYATEHREGGARALGIGVPGLGRADLSVFGEDEWRQQRPLLVHARWRELAKSGIRH